MLQSIRNRWNENLCIIIGRVCETPTELTSPELNFWVLSSLKVRWAQQWQRWQVVVPVVVRRAMSFHAHLSSSAWTPNTLPAASRDPRVTYPSASGECSFRMNGPKMPAERDRWEARYCKEIDKYTSADGGLHIARGFFFHFFKGTKGFIFSVFFVGRKGLLLFFFIFPKYFRTKWVVSRNSW